MRNNMKKEKPKMLYVYDYEQYPYAERVPYSVSSLLENSLGAYFEMFHLGEIEPLKADVVFNTLPMISRGGTGIDLFIKGKITMFYNTVPLEWPASKKEVDQWSDQCDIVFVASDIEVPTYGDKGRVLYSGVNPYYRYLPNVANYDIGFLGSEVVDYRINFLNEIERTFKLFRGAVPTGLGVPSARMLSKCRLVMSVEDYYEQDKGIEHRFWTFGNVRPILMYDSRDLSKNFREGVHYIGYRSNEEFMEKAKYYLANMHEADEIGDNLIREFREKHTFFHRAEKIYDEYKKLI